MGIRARTEEQVFLAALELTDPADHTAYLAKACGGDAAFRRQVDEPAPKLYVEGNSTMSSARRSSSKMEQGGDVKIITLSGGKVPVVEDLREGAREGFLDESRGCHLLLDFSKVESINRDDLTALVNLHKRMQRLGGRLTLFYLNAQVYEVFTLTRLHTVLTICS